MNVYVPAMGRQIDASFADDVLTGLTRKPKRLSPKYFYDEAGSHLFEQITLLPEYYPTRTELRILRERGADISARIPRNAALVEFGAGATTKVRLLLESCEVAAYVPVDISGAFLNGQAAALKRDFSGLAVHPVVADFTTSFALPEAVRDMPKVGFFPGSTIGNFDPDEARAFLCRARAILGDHSTMIVGVDLEKDEKVLRAAYNDAAGITAEFNLNVLLRINRELGGNFNIPAFSHSAVYDRERHRIEMHLVSRNTQQVHLLDRTIGFDAGESIHTESSYKYSIDRFQKLAQSSGWHACDVWTDDRTMFSVHALAAAA